MSAFLHHVASAALPVAVGLLVLAAVARVVLWTELGDAQAQSTARRYLEPLSVWCLGALAVYVLARSASGGSWLSSFAVGAALGGLATGLWLGGAEEPEERPAPPVARPPEPAPESLWAERVEESRPQRGLWSTGSQEPLRER